MSAADVQWVVLAFIVGVLARELTEAATATIGDVRDRIEARRVEARCQATIDRYDTICRANRSDDWDTLAAVGNCEDGPYGAFGEVLDTFFDLHGRRTTQAEHDRLYDLLTDHLQPAYRQEITHGN